MKVAILGYGVEGKASYDYWLAKGDEVTIFDEKPVTSAPASAAVKIGPRADWDLSGFDLAVRSPGLRLVDQAITVPMTSLIKEFLHVCPAPIIGVTGTKGKGTTTTLIAEMLRKAGRTVHVGGNIGRPPLEFLDQVKPDDIVVLELSSFQLMDVDRSPHIAVCLMIAPEHLDWHADFTEYVAAKANIFKFQKAGDLAIYDAKNQDSTEIARFSKGNRLPYLDRAGAYIEEGEIKFQDTVICRTDEVGLLGPHNLENICAAVAAVYGLVGWVEPLQVAIRAFKGLEHRLELAGEIGGVSYYDDSFATTPETAIAAIRSFPVPKVLILGGSDKKSDYTGLAKVIVADTVRQVILIGEMGQQIGRDLQAAGFNDITVGPSTMPEIVQTAKALAQPRDVVLLSPACASFGLFKDYKDRGDQFKHAVQAQVL